MEDMAQVRYTLSGLFEISQDPGQAGLDGLVSKPTTHRSGVNSWSLWRRRQTSARPNASHRPPQHTPPPLCQAEAVKRQRQNPCQRLQGSVAFKLILHVNNTPARLVSCCSYTSLWPPVGGGCRGALFGTPVHCATHLAMMLNQSICNSDWLKRRRHSPWKSGADLFVSGRPVWYFDQSPWTE